MEDQQTNMPFKKLFFSVFLARILSFIALVTVLGIIVGIVFLFDSNEPEVKANTILHVQLDGLIAEQATSSIDPVALSINQTKGLSALLNGLETAAEDDKIKGLFLDFGTLNCGMASAQELREGILRFKESKKFVVAYNSGEYVSQQAYYLASAADEVYGFPTSAFQWMGLGGELYFIKDLLSKIGVEVAILKGDNNDFKSAVEPLFLNKMSDSSRLQMNAYLQSTWNSMLDDIVTSRPLTTELLNSYANNLDLKNVGDAVEKGLIDKALYKDEVLKILMKKVNVKLQDDLNLYSFSKYSKDSFFKNQILAQGGEPTVAVILAEGSIAKNGKGFSSDNICKLFREARKMKSVKSIVFRVNSPGGSALASEEIWREVALTNKEKKVIVSMGDYAASGGYYVSTPAEFIFADPFTLTGSIGVFGVLPYTKKMLGKLGVDVDIIGTHEHSVMSLNRKLTDTEFSIAQNEVNEIYKQFLERVSNGRNLTKEAVNKIARGRVWTGDDAKRIGLVDSIGTLHAAINYAKAMNNIKDQKVIYYPELKQDPFNELISFIEGQDINVEASNTILRHPILKSIEESIQFSSEWNGTMMRLPFQLQYR
ncbi:MAG: signal peptide peptidase SppA [Crocinitomicaceae bacterium]|nr:signal peptide peptidase SppA [Crocinitomicaceae bacterium]